ncbi:Hydantoin permease, partial [Clarias magur]
MRRYSAHLNERKCLSCVEDMVAALINPCALLLSPILSLECVPLPSNRIFPLMFTCSSELVFSPACTAFCIPWRTAGKMGV